MGLLLSVAMPLTAAPILGDQRADWEVFMKRLHGLGLGGRLLLAFAVGGALFGIATAVQADIPDNGTIHSCYQKSNGQLRVIDASAGKTCNTSENPLGWSQTGSGGSTGATGATGARGASGPSGPRGASGPSGPRGASGPSGPRGATGPTGPGGGGSAPPDVNSFVSVTPFTAVDDGAWHAMPGVALPLAMGNAGPVQLDWGFSTIIGGGYVVTRIVLDGVPVAGSQRIAFGAYGSSSAVSSTTLASGPHLVTVEYKTATAFNFDPIDFDWQTASLQALAFDP